MTCLNLLPTLQVPPGVTSLHALLPGHLPMHPVSAEAGSVQSQSCLALKCCCLEVNPVPLTVVQAFKKV